MDSILVKPQVKDDEFFCKEVYADKLQNHFSLLCEKLDSPAVEDVEMLADMVYKAAYIDGFMDALYFKEL
ncbi:MAG: hypothetical protein MST07_00720 [Firmicutes bacterium]|nr:hypothetical protein [Bacillota bacterium]